MVPSGAIDESESDPDSHDGKTANENPATTKIMGTFQIYIFFYIVAGLLAISSCGRSGKWPCREQNKSNDE